MDTGVIIAIVIGALLVLALVMLLGRKGRERKLETKRGEAREIRRDAQVTEAQADRTRAEADERAAKARREEAAARETAAEAERHEEAAAERHAQADEHDPDVKGNGLKGKVFGRGKNDPDDRDRDRDIEVDRGRDAGAVQAGEGTVHEEVHRERDPGSQEVRREEVESRRFEE
jgi:hypothetical protein